MDFNYTLIGQLLAFILFVWFCMRFIWPQLLEILETREKEISDGLEDARRGKRELEDENHQRDVFVDEAKEEADRIKASASADLEQAAKKAREEIRSEVSALVVSGAEKVLRSEIDQDKNAEILDEISKEL